MKKLLNLITESLTRINLKSAYLSRFQRGSKLKCTKLPKVMVTTEGYIFFPPLVESDGETQSRAARD